MWVLPLDAILMACDVTMAVLILCLFYHGTIEFQFCSCMVLTLLNNSFNTFIQTGKWTLENGPVGYVGCHCKIDMLLVIGK